MLTNLANRRITLAITDPETVADEQDFLSLEVYPEMSIDTLKSSVQAEKLIEPAAQNLYHNGQLITDVSKTLQELQVSDGDMLALHVRDLRGPQALAAQPRPRPSNTSAAQRDPEMIRLQILGNPALRTEVARSNPELAAVVEDAERFSQVLTQEYDRERNQRDQRRREIETLNSDPFDIEAQMRIEEMIRQERVTENLQNAMEHNPEGESCVKPATAWPCLGGGREANRLAAVFGRVHMLYIDVEVNGHKTKAFVDSGAQATIMSPACAEACGIMRLVDKRFAGVARGVGTANIIGRVHSAQIKIGNLFLMCSFTVMEGKSVDLLLGLDMLKRHQAVLDLAKDKLIIQGEEVPFLGEANIPKDQDEVYQEEPKVAGPAGTTIGQRSGAVSAPTQPERAQTSRPPQASQPAVIRGPQPGQSSGRASTPAPASSGHSFPREHIEYLKQLGADEQKAIQLLEATGGNLEFAAGMIFDD